MKPQLPKGTKDYSSSECILKNKIITTLKNIFHLYGYSPLETPILERLDVLTSKYAGGEEIVKEVFSLTDQGNRQLGLRYDLTVPLARYIATNQKLKMPFKSYRIGEVFRDGPVGPGRYRQFTQCDIDIIGIPSPSQIAETELISLIIDAFSRLQLEVTIKVNNRKLLNELMAYCNIEKSKQEKVLLTIDKLEKSSTTAVKNELNNLLPPTKIEQLLTILTIKGTNEQKISKLKEILPNSDALTDLSNLFSTLNDLNLVSKHSKISLELSMVRGLSYYTGTVLETFLSNQTNKTDININSALCSGGRYDNMIGALSEKETYPAIGISFGIDRIFDALPQTEIEKTNVLLYLIPIKTLKETINIAKELRTEGINTDMDLLDRGPTNGLEYANSLGINHVVFVGKKELAQDKLKLKNMQTGKEELLTIDQLKQRFKNK